MKQNDQHKRLIKRCLRGHRDAQSELYKQHKVYLFGVCMRYAKNRAEAQDMLQEGFYKILKDLKQYNQQVPIQAWMRKVMVNTALMHIRKYRKVQYTEWQDHTHNHKDSDVSLMAGDRSKAIIHLIRSLPDTQQTVFNLRAIEGYSFKEIAQKLETKEATLRSHYLRARTALQTMLKKELN